MLVNRLEDRSLESPADRTRLLTLFDRLLGDDRFQSVKPTPDQVAMFERINALLRVERGRRPPPAKGAGPEHAH